MHTVPIPSSAEIRTGLLVIYLYAYSHQGSKSKHSRVPLGSVADPLVTFWYGSEPLTNGSRSESDYGSGSGSCYFRYWPSRWQLKFIYFSFCFCFLLFEATLKVDNNENGGGSGRWPIFPIGLRLWRSKFLWYLNFQFPLKTHISFSGLYGPKTRRFFNK